MNEDQARPVQYFPITLNYKHQPNSEELLEQEREEKANVSILTCLFRSLLYTCNKDSTFI